MTTFVHVIFIFCIIILLSLFQLHHSGSYSILNERSYNNFTTNSAMKAFHTHHHHHNRKLLFQGSLCRGRDLSISQSKGTTSGIPNYIVQIVNTCVSSSSEGGGCGASNIHLHCGWFASARIVNPRFFKRLSYDDCLVNSGQTLKSGQIITFSYSNSFMYPISLKHATFC